MTRTHHKKQYCRVKSANGSEGKLQYAEAAKLRGKQKRGDRRFQAGAGKSQQKGESGGEKTPQRPNALADIRAKGRKKITIGEIKHEIETHIEGKNLRSRREPQKGRRRAGRTQIKKKGHGVRA